MADLRLSGASRTLPGAAGPTVDGVDLDVRHGELMVLGGGSGSGKSTLLRMIVGLEPFDRGRLEIGGRDLTGSSADRRSVSLVYEGSALLPNLSLFENIALPLRLRGVSARRVQARVKQAAHDSGLCGPLTARPAGLDFDTRLRATLARAIVRGPELVCLDEPLVGPGTGSAAHAAAVIRQLQRDTGLTMIYASCRSADAFALADRVAVLHEGRLQQLGPPRELLERPATLAVAQYAGPAPMGLVTARVVERHAWLGGYPAELTEAQAKAVTGERVVVGLRPADLYVARGGPGIRAAVLRVKDAGRHRLVRVVAQLDDGPAELELEHTDGDPPAVGDRILIGVTPRAWHLFDAQTGVRLPD